MKRLVLLASAAAMLFCSTGTSSASSITTDNLLINGDFEAGIPIVNSDFSPSSGPFNIWLGSGVNILGGAGDFSAAFEIPADPANFPEADRLVQGINLNPDGILPGTHMQLGFDFRLLNSAPPDVNAPETATSEVFVLGLLDSDGPIKVSPAPGDGFPPGDVIFSQDLLTLTSIRNDWASGGGGFLVDKEYDSIAVVFNAGDLGFLLGDLADIDNVVLRKTPVQAPEPGSLLLLGSAMSAIVIARRKIQG